MTTALSSSSFQGWPRLQQTKGHPRPLVVNEVAEGLFTIGNALFPSECKEIIKAAEAMGMAATNPQNRAPPKGQAFRNNERLLVRDEAFADKFFRFLQPSLSTIVRADGATPVGLNPDFRIYRYHPGQSFGSHIDEPVLSENRKWESEFTLLIYLTGVNDQEPPLRGGETRFHRSKKDFIDIEPATGKCLLHWVLHDCLHEGLLVRSGIKWLLRTDVFFPRIGYFDKIVNAVAAGGNGEAALVATSEAEKKKKKGIRAGGGGRKKGK